MIFLVNIAAVFGAVLLSASGQQTLTTAKVIQDSTPKPTSLFRRLYVECNVEAITHTVLDLFHFKDPERRSRNRETVWNWDFWCQLQPKTGNCIKDGGTRTSFYYDSQLDQCFSFIYSGCDGNKNNFDTLVECERHCKGAIYMPIKETERQGSCTLQPNSGLCMALLQRYYYDVNTDACKKLIYGGCGGNQNRFQTNVQCLNNCKSHGI